MSVFARCPLQCSWEGAARGICNILVPLKELEVKGSNGAKEEQVVHCKSHHSTAKTTLLSMLRVQDDSAAACYYYDPLNPSSIICAHSRFT